MEALKRQIKFQLADTRRAIIIFWAIVIASNILFYFLNATTNNGMYGTGHMITVQSSNGQLVNTRYLNVAGSNVIAIWIFIIVYNMVMYYEIFPTAIGFSSTRKNFYLGAIIHNSILCFIMAVIEGVLLKLDRVIIKALGQNALDEFLMLDLKSVNIVYIIIVLFLIFILPCALFNLLGTILYKWGYKFWLVFLAGFIILANVRVEVPVRAFKAVSDFIFRFDGLMTFSAKTILVSALLYAVGWIFVRRRAVRTGR